MVSGVSDTQIYESSKLSGGGSLTKAQFTLAMLGYKLTYYLVLRYEPRKQSMVFRLDYSRYSDLDDSVGYWHVRERKLADGSIIQLL